MSSTTTGPGPATRRNLELKVRVTHAGLADIRQHAMEISDQPGEVLDQDDRYFTVRDGRLKLRTISRGASEPRAELIAYRRPDDAGSRWSAYRISTVPPGEADALAETLALVLPPLVRVRKQRTLVLHAATRIHLDSVEGLGAFVELETVVTSQGDHEARQQHQHVIDALSLHAWPVEAGSYSDLLLERKRSEAER